MKKIININLSGRVIPIEDAAYEKLQGYIESLRRYFANEEGRDEIINDIESRIAELMSDKIRLGSSAITEDDTSDIIASMGTIEDFEAVEQENNASASASSTVKEEQQNTYTDSRRSGRLYRDSNDKIIGGVCSGIANYLNIDPAVVRILFAIITFGGFGLGILAYIILWIVLPPKELDGISGKRLYRNPDNRVIGGVAGGLAAYFNRSATTIRLIFAAPVLLSILINILRAASRHSEFGFAWNIGFGSLTGTFILTYIILWIVLPEAGSEYQKMEMRGEKVDVNRIRQNVREGMNNMRDRMKGWGEEVKTTAQNLGNRTREMAGDMRDSVRNRRSGFGHAVGVIFKVFFLFIAGSIAFALFVALIALIFGGVAWWPINGFLWTSKTQQFLGWGTLIFFVAVPLIGFVLWVIRRIIRAKSKSNYLGWTFAGLWLIGWVCAILFASSISSDFRIHYKDDRREISITQPANNTMILAVTAPELENSDNMWWIDDESTGWSISADTLKLSTVYFDEFTKSVDNNYHVIVKRYSYGKSREDAMDRAADIQYTVTSKDSILDLGNGYAISRSKKFRFQQVHIEVQVPVGKRIRFDETIKDKLNPVSFRIGRSRHGIHYYDDGNRYWFDTGINYTMGADGRLMNNDAPAPAPVTSPASTNGKYKYEENTGVDSIQQEIERKKREIKELEDKKNQVPAKSTTKTTTKGDSKVNGKEDIASSPALLFSVTQYL